MTRLSEAELERLSDETAFNVRQVLKLSVAIASVNAVDAEDRRERFAAIIAGAAAGFGAYAWTLAAPGVTPAMVAKAFADALAGFLNMLAENDLDASDLDDLFQESGHVGTA